MSKEKPFAITIKPVWRDQDALGHVNNAVYSTWLENARGAYWRTFDEGCTLFPFVLARTEIDFREPATWNDVVTVKTWISRFGRSSFDFEYSINAADGRVIADAKTVQVMYDHATHRTVPVSTDLHGLLKDFDADPPASRI